MGFELEAGTRKSPAGVPGSDRPRLLNHPVWGFPNTNFSSPTFGRISSTAISMRQMQFALKYVF
jgi:hypothetical protein